MRQGPVVKVDIWWPRIQRKRLQLRREISKCQWGHWPFLLVGESVATPLWRKCESLTLPKMGLESPLRLPKIQNSITWVKTPCIEVFLIPLERSWSVDVQKGLAWAIWTYVAQVIGERSARSQIANLTPDH